MKELLKKLSTIKTTEEFKRLYHGRGEEEFKFLTIDSIGDILFIQFFEENEYENEILTLSKNLFSHKTIIVKKRYSNETFAIKGEIPKTAYAIENGFKFKLNFLNQNIGFFGDMKHGREFIKSISKDKKILNLFSYTCGFSLYAKSGGAKFIANVDMSKSALATGMANHQINDLEVKNVAFWPYNILKVFPKLKKQAPYDIIIIDPPSYQKGSFIASKDYIKIIKKLPQLSHKNTTLLACINSPKFTKEELIEMIEQNTDFKYEKSIPPAKEYKNSPLKNLVFNHI
ncbi:class I SAM-dependent methyltransferase [Caminibacter pacificus]